MARISRINSNQDLSQKAVEALSSAYSARQALQEAQLMNQFSQLLGQAALQVASQSSEQEVEKNTSSENLGIPVVPVSSESSPAPQEQIAVVSDQSAVAEQAPEASPASDVTLKAAVEVTTETKPSQSAPVEVKVEAATDKVQPAQAQAAPVTQAAVAPQAATAIAQAQEAEVVSPQTVKMTEQAVKVAAESGDLPRQTGQAAPQATQQATVAAPHSENAAPQSEAQAKQELLMQAPLKTAAAVESQFTTQSSSPAETATADKRPLPAAQPSLATHIEKTVSQTVAPETAQPAQSSPETQDLVVRLMQDIRDRAVRTEVKAEPATAQVAKPAFEYQAVNPVVQSTIPAQALQNAEKSLRFQSIGQPQMIELAQSAGREASRAQNVQSVLNLTAQGASTGKNEQNSASSRDAENSRTAKFLTRADTLRTLEKVENAIKEVAKSHDGKTISVRLDPPSLGSVKVDLTMRDGSIHARVVAELPQVANMLRDKIHELQTLIRQVGFDADQVSVSVGEQFSEKDRQTEYLEQSWFGATTAERGNGSGDAESALTGKAARAEGQVDDHWVA